MLELEVLIGERIAVDCSRDVSIRLQDSATVIVRSVAPGYVLDLPPVPSPLVKSPPWIMNCLMTRWKVEPS